MPGLKLGPLIERIPISNKLERIWILAKTDYIQRYYGSKLGIFWAFINPMLRVIIYFFVFTILFRSKIPNYGFYLFSGILLWRFFSESTNNAINLFKKKRYLILNININKLDLFYSTIVSSLIGLLINFFIYFVISLIFGIPYSLTVIFFPILILNTCMVILAVSMMLSVVSVYFKDIKHLWDLVLLLGLWVSPIFYGKSVIFRTFPALLYLNPLGGIFINLRHVMVYGRMPDMELLVFNLLYGILLLGIAYPLFNRLNSKAAEKL